VRAPVQATPRAAVVLAANPGPMTLDGTNTWLLAEPGGRRAVVVDPGPDDETHLAAVQAAATGRGVHVGLILLTHGHPDHAEGAERLHKQTGAPVRAADSAYRLGGPGLVDGDVVELDGLEVVVVGTPGHTADSVCFHLPADRALLTGDTVLGRGTTVVAPPDGRLGDYLASLRRLRTLVLATESTTLLPGHGPVLPDASAVLAAYLAHRSERLDQVREALAAGHRSTPEVVRHVYADVAPALWPAAELSVRAQLDYLREHAGPAAPG
jgi:glyoxylase-like metal-dependent hydrolase (beta-lactamase superfamily II)